MEPGVAPALRPTVARAVLGFGVMAAIILLPRGLSSGSWEWGDALFVSAGSTLTLFSLAYWRARRVSSSR
jgi:Na+-transporting NADH:ubiquinone oxidoreductase subunit NqrD